VRVDLIATVAGDGDDPHDPMSVWKSSREVDAGVIEVTAPVDDPEESGELVVFDPTRVVDGIELSDDPILRYRPKAYSESIARRPSSCPDLIAVGNAGQARVRRPGARCPHDHSVRRPPDRPRPCRPRRTRTASSWRARR